MSFHNVSPHRVELGFKRAVARASALRLCTLAREHDATFEVVGTPDMVDEQPELNNLADAAVDEAVATSPFRSQVASAAAHGSAASESLGDRESTVASASALHGQAPLNANAVPTFPPMHLLPLHAESILSRIGTPSSRCPKHESCPYTVEWLCR